MKQNLSKSLTWAVILSETGHLFCCVFPTIFSLLGLLAGAGLIATLPPSMVAFHEFMHAWEMPIIMMSGLILAFGWLATWYGEKVDCHDTGCAHGACAPTKNRAHLILKIATILFIFNVLIYVAVHRADWFTNLARQEQAKMHSHEHAGEDVSAH